MLKLRLILNARCSTWIKYFCKNAELFTSKHRGFRVLQGTSVKFPLKSRTGLVLLSVKINLAKLFFFP